MDRRGRPRVQTSDFGESLTDQSQLEMTSIGKIMERFGVTGIVEHLQGVDAMFMDVTELPEDYQAVCEYVNQAETEFKKLPSKVRELFDHDVAKWLDAAHDKEKRDAIAAKAPSELAKAGIRVAAPGAGGRGAEPAASGPAGAGGEESPAEAPA